MSLIGENVRNFFSGNSRSQIVKKNILYSLMLKFLGIGVSFLLVPMTIGYVSSELYGVWLTLSSVLSWLIFLDFGFGQGLKNKLTESIAYEDWEGGKKLVSTTYFLMLLIFLPVCIIIQFLIPLIDWCDLLNVSVEYKTDIVKTLHVLIAFFCMQMVANVILSVIAAFQRVALSNSFGVIGSILSLVIIVIIIRSVQPSLLCLCFSLALMPLLVTVVATYVLFKNSMSLVAPSFSYVDFTLIKDLFSLGYKFFIINIQAVVLYQSTNVIISNVSSPIWVTSYNISYKYLSIAMMLFTISIQPLWPAFADAYAKDDKIWMLNTARKMTSFYFLCCIACVLMAIIAPYFYSIWVGDKVIVPSEMTWLVCSYVIVYCWVSFNGILIVGTSKIKLNTIIVTIGMLVHIPLAYTLSQLISAYGVIVSMIVINLFYGVIYRIQLFKILRGRASGIWNE